MEAVARPEQARRAALRRTQRFLATHATITVFAGAERLATDPALTRSALRLVLLLMVECEPGNVLYVGSSVLAARLGLRAETCRRAWQLLLRQDYLRADRNDFGRVYRHRLSPHVCWKGRPWKARVVQRQWEAESALTRLAQQWQED